MLEVYKPQTSGVARGGRSGPGPGWRSSGPGCRK